MNGKVSPKLSMVDEVK